MHNQRVGSAARRLGAATQQSEGQSFLKASQSRRNRLFMTPSMLPFLLHALS